MSPPWVLDEEEEVAEEEEEEKGLKFLPMRLDPMRRKGSLVGAEEESSTYKKKRGALLRFRSQVYTIDTRHTEDHFLPWHNGMSYYNKQRRVKLKTPNPGRRHGLVLPIPSRHSEMLASETFISRSILG